MMGAYLFRTVASVLLLLLGRGQSKGQLFQALLTRPEGSQQRREVTAGSDRRR